LITYDPKALLRKIAPEAKIKRLVSKGNVSLKRSALSFVDSVDFLNKKSVSRVALETLKAYKKRIKVQDLDKSELLKDPRQLIQRVQNEVITQIAAEIKTAYAGEQYEWLPSDAEEPDPEHQLKYGEVFTVGDGEMPGDRYGCRCGMRILVKETELELG
jgi:hypothetical protein